MRVRPAGPDPEPPGQQARTGEPRACAKSRHHPRRANRQSQRPERQQCDGRKDAGRDQPGNLLYVHKSGVEAMEAIREHFHRLFHHCSASIRAAAVQVPVIGSLNGTSPEGWLDYARLIQDAGADALELNFYHVVTDPNQDGAALEQRLLDVVRAVKAHVRIPVAIKLSPFYSSFANLAHQLDDAGASGLVLFNRFYQPDIDPDALDAVPRLQLSDSGDLLLRLRWLAILSGRVRASLAATGGAHTCIDTVKAVMAGAHAVQMVAALLLHGPSHLAKIRRELSHWLEVREYESLEQAQGSMSLLRCPNPEAFERGNYMKVLQTWRAR
ncbi:MAG: dihydroorotate dehydrogenase-like protein [Acidobacteria bacterium]|nr:dihydroorotate dehydrogenase-like protein [Acidobacteriota bacterium]